VEPATDINQETQQNHESNPLNAQALAWIYTVIAFLLFVAAIVFLPGQIGQFMSRVTAPKNLYAQPIEGTVLLRGPEDMGWRPLQTPDTYPPGSRFATDGRSRAFLQLFDGSTIQLYNNSELRIRTSAQGRFNVDLQRLDLDLESGRISIGIAPVGPETDRLITIYMPPGKIDVEEGSYTIETLPDRSIEVFVRRGKATLFSGSDIAEVGMGGRGILVSNSPPITELTPRTSLVKNPDLDKSLNSDPWKPFTITESGPSGKIEHISFVEGKIVSGELQPDDGYTFRRTIPDSDLHRNGEAGIAQIIDRDIRDFTELAIRSLLKVDQQELSGGGSLGSEYPLMLRLYYVDSSGQDQVWHHGFYHQNKDSFSVQGGSFIPKNQWTVYDDPNLLQRLNPTPVFLRRVEVLGSGWSFDSSVRALYLEGR